MSSFSTSLAIITAAVSADQYPTLRSAFEGLSKFAAMLSPILSGSESTTFATCVFES